LQLTAIDCFFLFFCTRSNDVLHCYELAVRALAVYRLFQQGPNTTDEECGHFTEVTKTDQTAIAISEGRGSLDSLISEDVAQGPQCLATVVASNRECITD
jgi:hypothetical protein